MTGGRASIAWQLTISLPAAAAWRVLEVLPQTSLDDLSLAFQAALGFTYRSDYRFLILGKRYEDNGSSGGAERKREQCETTAIETVLSLPGERFSYRWRSEHDWWKHQVEFTAVVQRVPKREYPHLLDGAGEIPNDGFYGKDDFLAFSRARKSSSPEEREWAEDVRARRDRYFNSLNVHGFQDALRELRQD